MSVELVKQQIVNFLESERPEVMAIKGRWGIGKTYTWNKFATEHSKKIALNSYAYVSLFGLNSLKEIKAAVFENTVDSRMIGQKPNIQTFNQNYQSVIKTYSRKASALFRDIKIPVVSNNIEGLSSIFDSLSYLSLNKTLICFDDLERHGQNLNLKDFLGLVSFLKEQKDCKIVILLNEDADGLNDYFSYKEKVIDKQLHFEPNAEECIKLAINQSDYPIHYEAIKEYCSLLDIKNIRVLRKIQNHLNEVLPETIDFDHAIQSQVVNSTIIMSWCYYTHASAPEEIPDLNFLKTNTSTYLNQDIVKSEPTKNHWDERLRGFGYYKPDDLNRVIAESIENGFLNKTEFLHFCKKKQEQIDSKKLTSAYHQAWELFHASFDNNTDEIIKAMETALKESISKLSMREYSSCISLIRDIGTEDKAIELTKYYIDYWIPKNIEMLDISDPFSTNDSEFHNALKAEFDKKSEESTPEIILERWKNQSSYNVSDAKILGKLTKNELKEMFKGFKGDNLTDYIRVCLLLGNSSDALRKNTHDALTEIGKESPLNKQRLGKFRI